MSAIVDCTHCCSTDRDGSLPLWCHYYDSARVEEELNYCSPLEPHDCNRHADDTAVYAEVVAVLFLYLRHICDCCEESNPYVMTDNVAADTDVVAEVEADEVVDVDMTQNDHMMNPEEEGPSLPSQHFAEVMSIPSHRTYFESLWLLRNYGHDCDSSATSLMSVSYCKEMVV